jgi:hypothetical protein
MPGSNQTASHVARGGASQMFAGFEAQAQILRVYGVRRHLPGGEGYDALAAA